LVAYTGILRMYSFFFKGVKVVTTFVSSFGKRYALAGSKLTSVLYFSGTFHSNSKGILASFLIDNFYLLDTPVKVGGKKSFP
jgi:hypothetical protein